MPALHSATHPSLDVEGCWQCKIANVQIGSFPTEPALTERRWDKDMASYRALRKDGLQPPGIDGSTKLETASSQFEVEMGQVLEKKDLAAAQAGIKQAKDLGLA